MNRHKGQSSDEDGDDNPNISGDLSSNSEDELNDIQPRKSLQTKKRRLRASQPSAFGATLQTLLNTDTPNELPLSLKPSIGRKQNDDKLELKAKKALQIEKQEHEDTGRIKDVIGGWGGESERSLRKVAQRGVVQLFNAVQQSQLSAAQATEKNKRERGSGRPSLPAPSSEPKAKSGKHKKDNELGRAKTVDKDEFFEIIKAGGIVSKS